ncbi:MAG: phosphotransferase [Umezawaea sp.]
MTPHESPAERSLRPDLAELVCAACATAGLDGSGARVIHHYANAVVHLPAERAVARITGPGHTDRARLGLEVTRWLSTEAGFPATAPLAEVGPVELADATVTFWRHYPQPDRTPPGSADLGAVVRRLHDLPLPQQQLPRWRPLHALHAEVADPAQSAALDEPDRVWLLSRIEQVRQELATLEFPLGWGMVHADAWAGNLLWDTTSATEPVLLGDWDSVCHGPREIDLIPAWHAAVRYAKGSRWADDFAHTYGHDLAAWPGFATLFAMRDLVQIAGPLRRAPHDAAFARALRERVAGVRADDRGPWIAF